MSNQTKIKSIDQDNEVFKTKQELKKLNEQYRVKQIAYKDLSKQFDTDKSQAEETLGNLKNEVAGQKALLKTAKKDLKETKDLLKKQEAQIDEAVKNGNGHIMDLQYEAGNLEDIKGRLEYEIATMTRTRDELITAVNELSQKRIDLDKKYTDQNKLYQATLSALQDRIFTANSELKDTQDKAKEIVTRLMDKEKELELASN